MMTTDGDRGGWIDRVAELVGEVRTDFLDIPTAWTIQKAVGAQLEHHTRCSSVAGWDKLSGPSLLCDCKAVPTMWGLLVKRQEAL